ncbi:MAG: putative zinc-binding metallopeptidase [Candidatus Nanopelagicales bacterium]
MSAFAAAEAAKRRLVYQLMDLRLPISSKQDDPRGLAFDLLSSTNEPVTTGHADGVVTIDLAEGHDPHREAMRVQMGEPYRTMLGHLRHEVGHYYFQVLVERSSAEALTAFRNLFGDERTDYGQALERHYAQGAPEGWQVTHISAYATAHPWEDWAETFAHYLHILDTLQTAAAWGVAVTGPDAGADVQAHPGDEERDSAGIRSIVATWLPLTYALNAMNRSMGKDDLYPFILTESVIAKLDFVHRLVVGNTATIPTGTG